jgi:hypothetical protein
LAGKSSAVSYSARIGAVEEGQPTRDRAQLREALRAYVAQHIVAMTKAQVEPAKGVSVMVLRHPDGTFTWATDEAQIDAALAAGAEAFTIFTQAPSTKGFTALLDRPSTSRSSCSGRNSDTCVAFPGAVTHGEGAASSSTAVRQSKRATAVVAVTLRSWKTK